MLPIPRRPESAERSSMDAHSPRGTGRSSSAEHGRASSAELGRSNNAELGRSNNAEFGRSNNAELGPSEDASVSKIPANTKSKSQQGECYGQSSTSPLGNSTTATPARTPSEDRSSPSWQTSVDRALAFVTVKDQRPISNEAWQREEFARVSKALAARGGGAEALALIRPLTITRFVQIMEHLLKTIMGDAKLNNDNYVAKLPKLAKRFLYPGTVSKSWLRAVDTLDAFPDALALISYFLNLVSHIEETRAQLTELKARIEQKRRAVEAAAAREAKARAEKRRQIVERLDALRRSEQLDAERRSEQLDARGPGQGNSATTEPTKADDAKTGQ